MSRIDSRDTDGEIRAVFDWVRAHVPYRQDPVALELLETPERALEEIDAARGYGLDCDGFTILIASLLGAMGHPVRIVVTGHREGRYDHIYPEAYSRQAARWIALDLAMPQEDMGWQLQNPATRTVIPLELGDLLPGPWPEESGASNEMHPEQMGRSAADYDSGAIVVLPDGGAWVRCGKPGAAGYWRLAERTTPGSVLGQVERHPDTRFEFDPSRRVGREDDVDFEIRPWLVDYSDANQQAYILLTQPNVNPINLRKRFGFRRPLAQRKIAYRQRDEWRRAHIDIKAMDKDLVKVTHPGHVSGNSMEIMFDYLSQWYPDEEQPDAPSDAPTDPGEMAPLWAGLLVEPEDFGFHRNTWGFVRTQQMLHTITVQSALEFIDAFLGENILPEAFNTEEAKNTIIEIQQLRSAIDDYQQLGIGLLEILAIITAIVTALGLLWDKLSAAAGYIKELAEGIIAYFSEAKTKLKAAADSAGGMMDDADNFQKSFESELDGATKTGQEWLDEYGGQQALAMQLAVAKDDINRLYSIVKAYGFSSPEAAVFRQLVETLVNQGSLFFCLAKEICLRDARRLKIEALSGSEDARAGYVSIIEDMLGAGDIISSWAEQYNALPWDFDNVEIPNVPSPYPPDSLPDGSYPWTPDDKDQGRPHGDDEEAEKEFEKQLEEQRAVTRATGYTWPGAGVQWGGMATAQGAKLDPSARGERAPGAGEDEVIYREPGDTSPDDAWPGDDDTRTTDVTREQNTESKKSWVGEHPFLSLGIGLLAAGGTYYGVKKWRR